MADITKCANDKCEKREQCYRWTAPDSYWQSYSSFQPDLNGQCKDFMLKENDK